MLEEKSMIGYWTIKTSETLWQTKILALAENSEKIPDSLEQRFGQKETFRAILFQVEASLPRAKEEERRREGTREKAWEGNLQADKQRRTVPRHHGNDL
ncbi:MAG: hypothetical protein ACP5FY_09525 [Kosmotogaceae bacterium]